MHVDLRLFLNILVFKQVLINGITEANKMLWKNEDDFTYLKVNLNMQLKKKG